MIRVYRCGRQACEDVVEDPATWVLPSDVVWIDRELCFLAEGLRTNQEGADQVERILREIGVKEEQLRGFAERAHGIRRVMRVNPRNATVEEVEGIYRSAY